MNELNNFLMGGIVVGYALASLFFLRFWNKTRDRLFVMFGIAFAILGIIRIALFSLGETVEDYHYIYWLRFAAYALILLAIVDKNRGK